MIYLLSDFPMNTANRAIGAYRLATELRDHGYDVEVIDFCSIWTPEEILNFIDAGPKPSWIGFSTTFSAGNISSNSQLTHTGIQIMDRISRFEDDDFFYQQLQKRAPIVIGGARTARLKYWYAADFFVEGYADIAIVAIANYFSNKDKNLKYKEESIHLINNPGIKVCQKIINCQEDYVVTDVSDIKTMYHANDFIEDGEILPIEISRGCIFSCAFCAFPLNGKKKNDYIRPKDQLIEDITNYQKKYKTQKFLVLDDTFNDTVEKMEMMSEIQSKIPYNFKFWAYGRLDLISSNRKMFDLIKPSGWEWLSFGVETFKKEAGSKIGKGYNPKKLKSTLKETKEIHPELFFNLELIVGLPGETESDILDTELWLKNNPTLWDYANIKCLGIPNPKYVTWHSKMQTNPNKYGLTLTENDVTNNYLGWKHDTMDSNEALQLSLKVGSWLTDNCHTLPSSVPDRMKTSYFIDMANISKPVTRLSWQHYTTNFYYRYKVKKLASRNLTTSVKKHVGVPITESMKNYFEMSGKNGTS